MPPPSPNGSWQVLRRGVVTAMLVVNQSGNATVPSLFNVQVNGSNDWRFAAGRQGRSSHCRHGAGIARLLLVAHNGHRDLKLGPLCTEDHFLSTEGPRYNNLQPRFVQRMGVGGGFMKHAVWLGVCAWVFVLAWGTPGAVAADNEKVAAELQTIIDSGEPAIGNEDNDERIVEVYVFYAADRDYKPLWVRDNGPKSKAREVLAVFKAADEMGLNPANYRVAEIEKRMNATTPARACRARAACSAAPSSISAATSTGARRAEQRECRKRHHRQGARAAHPHRWRRSRRQHCRICRHTRTATTANIIASKSALAAYREISAKGGWPTVPKGPALKPGMSDGVFRPSAKRLQITGDLDATPTGAATLYDPALETR